ncbi:efflux RND transporter periplasmic adaptor subunit, partial [Mitsuaria sp. TWR114]
MAGRSSRSFLREGRWAEVRSLLKPGDAVLIQFGHNDLGRVGDPAAKQRGVLPGIGDETVEEALPDGGVEQVRSFGAYLTAYLRDARAAGAVPVVVSPVPHRDHWRDDVDFPEIGAWGREVARREGGWFIDLTGAVTGAYRALGQAEGQLARDKATLDNARIDLARYQDLLAKDAIARQQVDTQQATVRQLDGTVKADQAAVDSARLQVTYTRVLAPISGRVGLKQVDIGNVVQTSDANGVVSITQTRPIALTFAVPSALLPQVTAGLKDKASLTVEAWSRDGKTRLATGRLATADNAIDLSTDTIKLKALFPNEDDALYPNQSVSVKLQLATEANRLAVPAAAVLRGAQGFYVYVVGPGQHRE